MAEFRMDPLRGHTVLINGQRGSRPLEFTLTVHAASAENCPFCRGHEAMTPPSIEQDSATEWNWRVFPNRYPAVFADAKPDVDNEFVLEAVGRHEVLVESADHDAQAIEYSSAQWVEIFKVWQRRLRVHYADDRVRYVHIFRNQGYRGGATLAHPHHQLVGLPIVPAAIEARLSRLKSSEARCLHCVWVDHESEENTRLLHETNEMIALASFAPRFPFEWQIIPREHLRFDELTQNVLERLAALFQKGLGAMKRACANPDFNLVLFSTPPWFKGQAIWSLEFLPRISTQAGFEWGTGVHIVSTPPEEAASLLRQSGWGDA